MDPEIPCTALWAHWIGGTSWCASWMFCMMEDEVNKIITPCHTKSCPPQSQWLNLVRNPRYYDVQTTDWCYDPDSKKKHSFIKKYISSIFASTWRQWVLVELKLQLVAVSDFFWQKSFQFSGHKTELWETEGCYQWLSSDKSWELHPCQHSCNKPLMIELWWLSICSAQPVHALFPTSERLW